MGTEPQEYIDLAVACHLDDFERVKSIVENNPHIDLNRQVNHSKSRRNGAPLVLTGDPEIADYLIKKGARVNEKYEHSGVWITPLDSAEKELTKETALHDENIKAKAEAYIDFLKRNGAKTYEELQGDEK